MNENHTGFLGEHGQPESIGVGGVLLQTLSLQCSEGTLMTAPFVFKERYDIGIFKCTRNATLLPTQRDDTVKLYCQHITT